ncbi:DUF1838 family protein [Halotia wernerae UHCC 0503]|nr:DUF1838 family protein [Halotia wernerae UHCC 0503]
MNDRPQAGVSRRRMLQAAAATTLPASIALRPLHAAARPLDPARAEDLALLYRKLVYRSDDGIVWWWLKGPKYGQVNATLTPLFMLNVGTVQRVRQRSDGGFDLTSLETVFLSDVETGEPLSTWRNPYTGEGLPVKMTPVGPTTIAYQADNSRTLPRELGGSRLEATSIRHAPEIVNDDVFLRADDQAKVFSPGRATPFEVNDLTTYQGSLRELSDPAVTMASARAFFAEVTGWQRWMKMGDRPGGLTSRSSGAKVKSCAEMPARWRAMLEIQAPEIAADPLAALDRPAAKFDR